MPCRPVCQLALERGRECHGEAPARRARYAPQDEALDVDVDPCRHVQSLMFAPVTGLSPFSSSCRAERASRAMVTGRPVSAARNAALTATFRIVPPAIARRASFVWSRPLVRTPMGNTPRQM